MTTEMFFVVLAIFGIWLLSFVISYLLSIVFLDWLGYEDGRTKKLYALALSVIPHRGIMGWLQLGLIGFIIWQRPNSGKW